MTIIFCLGRNGDIVNALPIAWHLAQSGNRPKWLVAAEHATILDGVSYVEPKIWNGSYNEPGRAMEELRTSYPDAQIINAQCYRNPDQRHLTESYQLESWRIAGYLEAFGKWPTVFDKRSQTRETALRKKLPSKPFILVSVHGISSPFSAGQTLLNLLKKAITTHEIVDMATLKCERVYDLLAVMDQAALIISVDSVLLHLARACATPIVAIINGGWAGSVPPPTTICTFRYGPANERPEAIVENVLTYFGLFKPEKPEIFHVVDMFCSHARALTARDSWKVFHEGCTPVLIPTSEHVRNAIDIGDPRSLPFLKDLLNAAMEKAKENDIILWTNDDVSLDPRLAEWVRGAVGPIGATSMRRIDTEGSGVHMGRDLFAFTKRWLLDHWAEIPDFYLGAPAFDLVLAAMIRRDRGIVTTLANLHDDFPPCDATERYVFHESHPSAWAGVNETTYPANRYNVDLANEWCRKHCPTLCL